MTYLRSDRDAEADTADDSIVRVENDFDFLTVEYAELFQNSIATSFQRPLWLHHLYGRLVGDLAAEPLIITIRHPRTGRLKALLPLVIQRAAGLRIAQPADLGVSDYNAVICSEDAIRAFMNSGETLSGIIDAVKIADVIFFRKVRQFASETSVLLGNAMLSFNENRAHRLTLDGDDFDEWKRLYMGKNLRKNMRRRKTKLHAAHEQVEFLDLTSGKDIADALTFIRRQRTERFPDDILHAQPYFDFYCTYAQDAIAHGEAKLSGLFVDGRLIAADFGIMGDDCFTSILCGARLDAFGSYSPGLQSLLSVVRGRYESGDSHFDLGIGNADYKTEIGAEQIILSNITAAHSFKGRMAATVYHRAKPIKNLMRRFVGHVR